jgi:hypothetical protein
MSDASISAEPSVVLRVRRIALLKGSNISAARRPILCVVQLHRFRGRQSRRRDTISCPRAMTTCCTS